MTELWVKDKEGKARDIILGYDDNVRSIVRITYRTTLNIDIHFNRLVS